MSDFAVFYSSSFVTSDLSRPQIVQKHGRLPVDLFGIMLAM